MADAPLEMVVMAFNDVDEAQNTLKDLRRLQKAGMIRIINAAILEKDEKGHAKIRETQDVGAGRGAVFGAVVGGLVGLLGGPAGAVLGAGIGAGIGAGTAAGVDLGFPNDQLKRLQENLTPGSSAIITLLEHEWLEKLVEALENEVEATVQEIVQFSLGQEIVRQLEEQSDD